MKVAIIGYYGRNFGDLLMLHGLLTELKGVPITIFTYARAADLKAFLVNRSEISVVGLTEEPMWKIMRQIGFGSAIIWGGGTCFMDEGGTGGIKYMLLARLLGGRVVYLGIGADSHRRLTTRASMWAAVTMSSAMFVRDADSFKTLASVRPKYCKKIKSGSDLAYEAVSSFVSDFRPFLESYVVFCPRNLSGYPHVPTEDSNLLQNLCMEIARSLPTTNIAVVNCDPQVDTASAQKSVHAFVERGFRTSVIDGSNLSHAIGSFKYAEFILSVRLHPAIVAAVLDVPFALYNYSDKNKKLVTEIGVPERLVCAGAVASFEPDRGPLSAHTYVDKQIAVLTEVFASLRSIICSR
ncbi:MAG: polysaccharide pyruvyl transferase family protein [Herbaspirillum sp.]